jgi:hypothetical protein
MTDYLPLLTRAVANLDNNPEARRKVYDRARQALLAQLRAMNPPLAEAEITRERLALEEAIRRLDQQAGKGAAATPDGTDGRGKGGGTGGCDGGTRGYSAARAHGPAHGAGGTASGRCSRDKSTAGAAGFRARSPDRTGKRGENRPRCGVRCPASGFKPR